MTPKSRIHKHDLTDQLNIFDRAYKLSKSCHRSNRTTAIARLPRVWKADEVNSRPLGTTALVRGRRDGGVVVRNYQAVHLPDDELLPLASSNEIQRNQRGMNMSRFAGRAIAFTFATLASDDPTAGWVPFGYPSLAMGKHWRSMSCGIVQESTEPPGKVPVFMVPINLATGEITIRQRELLRWKCMSSMRFHKKQGRIATLTAVRPPARFGGLELDGDRVSTFVEKPQSSEGWINGGFFVFEPAVFECVAGDETLLEHEPLVGLAQGGQLSCYRHDGFWQPMDTVRDKRLLEDLWTSGKPLWVKP